MVSDEGKEGMAGINRQTETKKSTRPLTSSPLTECEGVGVKRAWEANVVVLQRRSEEHAKAQEHLQQLTAERAGLKAQVRRRRTDTRKIGNQERVYDKIGEK